jgi:hypothetical protein
MTDLKRCDRCGAVGNPNSYSQVTIDGVYDMNTGNMPGKHDLCHRCVGLVYEVLRSRSGRKGELLGSPAHEPAPSEG